MELTKTVRLAIFALIIFSIGLTALYFFQKKVFVQQITTMENDSEAIKNLHEKDMAASKKGDFKTLRSLISDDAVVMPPDAKLLRGGKKIDVYFGQMKEAMSRIEVLDYVLDFEEVKILGDYAYEWGEIRGRMRQKDSDKVESSSFKVMRILQKQADGRWKVHRSMWNANLPEAAK